MDKWWDHGKNEGSDNDTYPLLYESPYITRPVKWCIEEQNEQNVS